MSKDPSAVSQVFEWLEAQPVGTVLYSWDAYAALPHLNPAHVSAALSLLAHQRYGVLYKMPREGRYQPYRITSEVEHGWQGKSVPDRKGGESRPRRKQDPTREDVRQFATEALFEAAIMCEDGMPTDEVLAQIRVGYYALKFNRMEEGENDEQ